MNRPAEQPPRDTDMSGISINTGSISGGQFGGQGSAFYAGPAAGQAQAAAPGLAAAPAPDRDIAGPPVNSLHAFGDIVGYSRLNAGQQRYFQDRFIGMLNGSLVEAGVRLESVVSQDQGDARMLSFPVDTDVARVLAVVPRRFNDELRVHNQDVAAHARLRVRLSFTMGPTAPGRTGMTGAAPIAVVRLSNAAQLRYAMQAAQQAHLGEIIDDYLYRGYVAQRFRSDLDPEDYVPVTVADPEKAFEAAAWIRIFGCSPQQVASWIGQSRS